MASTVVKVRKISSISANMKYLQNKDEHPETCWTYSTCDESVWREYAAVNRKAFKSSGQSGRCVEAREAIFVFPEEFYRLPDGGRKKFFHAFVDYLKKEYGFEIYAAMHGRDKDATNLHIHVMYMERERILEKDKIAKRNMYFDPEGKQVRAKKDAIDQDGNLLPGYRMVPKGECYGKTSWTAKNKWLHSKEFTQELKQKLTNVINLQKKQAWARDMEEREVYDREKSPYLPLQDTYKEFKYRSPDNPKETLRKQSETSRDIIKCNELRTEYNDQVKAAIRHGADIDQLVAHRKKVSAEIAAACEIGQKNQIKAIITTAIEILQQLIKELISKIRVPKSIDQRISGAQKSATATRTRRTNQQERRAADTERSR